MKTKVLLSSVLTIVLCLCLIAGSTFALFTSTSKVNISVTAGQVDMEADLVDLTLYSVKGDPNGTIEDENGNKYVYEEVTQFANGGTATFDNAVLTLNKITPGDKVEFAIIGTNTSDVAAKYRYVIECVDGFMLMSGLEITLNDTVYKSLASYTSPWFEIGVNENLEDKTPMNLVVELPVTAGNEYQAQGAEIRIVVEAVQGNAVVDANTEPTIVYISNATTPAELAAALNDSTVSAVNVLADMDLTIDSDLANKTIYANGNDVALTFKGALENVVVDGIVAKEAGKNIDITGATGDITIVNSSFIAPSGASAVSLGLNVDLTVDHCDFVGGPAGKTYGLYNSGAVGALTVTNSSFEGFSSWSIMVNNQINGDVVIDNCVFNTEDGVFKTLAGGIQGNFTFTNNTMNALGHDGNIDKVLVSGSGTGPVVCTGTKTMTGNTLNGVEWAQ